MADLPAPIQINVGAAEHNDVDSIDIDHMTEAELLELNHRIVARLRFMQQARAHGKMLQFSVGQRVRFNNGSRVIEGTLTKYNRKTVTVITADGMHWNVGPGLLQPA